MTLLLMMEEQPSMFRLANGHETVRQLLVDLAADIDRLIITDEVDIKEGGEIGDE